MERQVFSIVSSKRLIIGLYFGASNKIFLLVRRVSMTPIVKSGNLETAEGEAAIDGYHNSNLPIRRQSREFARADGRA